MGSYEESRIETLPLREDVLKRPGMYFGDMTTGDPYAYILSDLVDATLLWKLGANLVLDLLPDNHVRMTCKARMPDGSVPSTFHGRKPLMVYQNRKVVLQGAGFISSPMPANSVACDSMLWEIRDEDLEHVVLIKEGVCTAMRYATPNLPMDLCLRVNLRIGTQRLPMLPADIGAVAKRIRYMSGPPDAGYWGYVTIRDRRVNAWRNVFITNPPAGPYWNRDNGTTSSI